VEYDIVEGDFSKTSGYSGAAKLLHHYEAPTLIMTSSDRCAFGVLQYAAAQGIRVPEDVSVIGYDNLPPVKEYNSPSFHDRSSGNRISPQGDSPID